MSDYRNLTEKLHHAQEMLLTAVAEFSFFIDNEYKNAESAYRAAHGAAMLSAVGTEKVKKAAADVAASAEMARKNAAEARYEWHKESVRSLRQYLSSVQSEAAGHREEDKATNYAGTSQRGGEESPF